MAGGWGARAEEPLTVAAVSASAPPQGAGPEGKAGCEGLLGEGGQGNWAPSAGLGCSTRCRSGSPGRRDLSLRAGGTPHPGASRFRLKEQSQAGVGG